MARLATYRGIGAVGTLVETLSTASTALTLTDDQQGKLLLWPGHSSASRIRLPAPEAGMVYNFAFMGPAASTATKILSSGAYDIYTTGTTGKGVSRASTVENGSVLTLVAISDTRWLALDAGVSTVAVASTST